MWSNRPQVVRRVRRAGEGRGAWGSTRSTGWCRWCTRMPSCTPRPCSSATCTSAPGPTSGPSPACAATSAASSSGPGANIQDSCVMHSFPGRRLHGGARGPHRPRRGAARLHRPLGGDGRHERGGDGRCRHRQPGARGGQRLHPRRAGRAARPPRRRQPRQGHQGARRRGAGVEGQRHPRLPGARPAVAGQPGGGGAAARRRSRTARRCPPRRRPPRPRSRCTSSAATADGPAGPGREKEAATRSHPP